MKTIVIYKKRETNYNNLMLDPEKSWLYTIYEDIEVISI